MSIPPAPALGPSPLAGGERQLSVAEAQAAIAAVIRPISGCEILPMMACLGRVLADDLISPIDVPAHDNSAMDGYALAATDLRSDAPTQLRVVGTVYAGTPFDGRLAAGDCLRIMTGAVMPDGLDTVVPQELCRAAEGRVEIAAGVITAGENRRRRGEDLALGRPALRAGRVLKPADMGLIASLGIAELPVRRRLRVALFSTGDELRGLGETLDAGCIYDSNRYSLMAALQRLGCEVVDLGLVRDDPQALGATLARAVASADVVLTSGGVSAGDADYTRDLLASLGEVGFWKVAMRPGRPFAFGTLRPLAAASHGDVVRGADSGSGGDSDSPVDSQSTPRWLFALPGNPVAALVTFYALARGALLSLAGAQPEPLPVLQARCTAAIRKRPGRTEFQRAVVGRAPDGGWQVRLTGSQGAGVLRSMSEANALIVLGHEQGSVAAGEPVDVWLFDGLV